MENKENNILNKKGFFVGLMMGGLAGAGAMILLAPQSGKNTRTLIQEKSFELRDQSVKAVKDTVDQVRTNAFQIKTNVQKQAEELLQRGEEILDTRN